MQINVWNVNQIESAQSAVNRGLNCRQQCDRQQCWPTPNKCWKVAPVWGWGIGDRVSMARFWGNSTNRKSVSTVKFWTDATVPHRSRTFDSSVKFRFISVRDLSSLCSNPMSMMPNWNLANCTNELTKSLTKSISRQRSAWTSIDNLNSNVTMNACIVSCRFAEVLDDGENRSIIKKMRMKVSRWRTWTLNNKRTWGGDLMNRQKNSERIVPFFMSFSPMFDDDGREIFTCGYLNGWNKNTKSLTHQHIDSGWENTIILTSQSQTKIGKSFAKLRKFRQPDTIRPTC